MQTSGVNDQASFDHHCPFTFLGVASPGIMGDREILLQVYLCGISESLPH
jgi:hypothetical protein